MLAVFFALILSACASPQSKNTHVIQHLPVKPIVAQQPPVDIYQQTSATTLDTPIQFQSLFLQHLTAKDMVIIQDEARRVSQILWASMDKRALYVRQRILLKLKALQAPEELQFVPVAESAYQPYALSPAGALGLWQLMPATAKELGTTHRNGIDGRRDIEQSSQAAITYLLQLHARFDNWTLAICAYNLGPWGVERRLRKTPWTPAQGLDALPFPRETKHYVKQILGMIALHEQGELQFSPPSPIQSINIQAPVDLKAIETAAGLQQHDVFRFNPGFDYQHYLHHDTQVFLPQENIQRLKLHMQNNPDAFKPKYISITIQKGDNLWDIARQYRTSIKQLRQLNPHLKNILSIGHQLSVPTAGSSKHVASKTNPLLSQGRRIRYKVRSGDSLWKIAQKFGTSAKAIARTNQMSTRRLIRPGDKLWILARFRPS
ncbi:MAG: LysM peptidoglycan-binding domain-containing protein [Mariprofundaceae bacterium]|nr:LysM peptidoglycan-binding domain-containing protein [Mariprofundaceae bacterium]